MNGLRKRLRFFVTALGPGCVTGAADDDPSGIGTYSIAGAQTGLQFLWAAFFTWPLMAAVQMMCARIGIVTGAGLSSALKKKFPPWLLIAFAALLWFANVFNIGADLLAMSDSASMLTGLSTSLYLFLFSAAITAATIWLNYAHIAKVLKWLAISLFAYVIAAFAIGPDWHEVMVHAFSPSWPSGRTAWALLVALLGTTISPYLFYWQASLEVEEAGEGGWLRKKRRPNNLFSARSIDVGVGTFFSNLVMFFIILTTGLTLHAHGIVNIETSEDAARALRPLAGNLASLLYTLGVVGTGLLAIPTLTGSAAYAWAEIFQWQVGLNSTFKNARSFYLMIILSTTLGLLISLLRMPPVKILFISAVINGLLAPFLLIGILIVASDKKIMKSQCSSSLARAIVGVTAVLMLGCAVAMFLL